MEQQVEQLKKILLEELDVYKYLLEISTNKTDIITSGKVSELDKITQIEQTLIVKIGKLEDERDKLVESIKKYLGTTDDLNITNLSNQLEEKYSKEIISIRNKLLDILNKIKERNDLNSVLIKDSLDYINFNLNLLTNATSDGTYNNKVKKEGVDQQKSLFDTKI